MPAHLTNSYFYPIAFGADSGTLLGWLDFNRLVLMAEPTGQILREWHSQIGRPVVSGDDNWLTAAAVSDDARLAAVGSGTGEVVVLDYATFQPVLRFPKLEYRIRSLRFLPDGRTLFAASYRNDIILWSLRPPPNDPPFAPATVWDALAATDAYAAYRAMWHLADHWADHAALLRDKLPPETGPDPTDNLPQWLADLDAPAFASRAAATASLRDLLTAHPPTRAMLEKERSATTSAEVRQRLDGLLAAKVPSPTAADLRRGRVLAAAVLAGDPAGALLTAWAAGTPNRPLTVEAAATRARLPNIPK